MSFFIYIIKTNGINCYRGKMAKLSLVFGSLVSTDMRNDWLHVMWFVEGRLLSYRMPVKFRERRLCNGFALYFLLFFSLLYFSLLYHYKFDKPMLLFGHLFCPDVPCFPLFRITPAQISYVLLFPDT